MALYELYSRLPKNRTGAEKPNTLYHALTKRSINMGFVAPEAYFYKLSEYVQFVKFGRTFAIVGRKT